MILEPLRIDCTQMVAPSLDRTGNNVFDYVNSTRPKVLERFIQKRSIPLESV